MPKSDTWPGGFGLETMNGMDSAGSCDSVVSSDDSMEHLSAEEKACLMFLEETIESLDTEEDSGLSNDEPDQLPIAGNLATKVADLSTAEAPLPRGPLSYEALFYLRRSASTKKTPLCPTIDHTIESDKRLPVTVESQNLCNPPKSVRFHPEVSISKMSPPVVAPKPKKIPANICVKTQKEASIKVSSYNSKHVTDPKVVRQEALQKLGLLKDQEPENHTAATLSPPESLSSLDRTSDGLTKGPSYGNPSRSPSFCHSQVRAEPKAKPLQSSASFHHYSRQEQQPVFVSNPTQSNGVKPERLGRSNTLDNHRSGGNCTELQHNTATKPVNATATQPAPNKPSNTVPYTVMVVPGMGADRREALRKLGLLKI
uniref:Zgc:158258 n=1 Tax=Labrus bergylta TaxID=56723 RepID=A0A3Q3EQF3_9LABR